jgi:chaperonin GroEL
MIPNKTSQPHTSAKPKFFIGSSIEGLPVANAIQENLDYDAEITVWPQGVFRLSTTAVDSLIRVLEGVDFGVFVFTPDDVLLLRGEKKDAVRDNVVFELGLFIGRLGRQRCFIVQPRGHSELHLPSDLAGLSPADYEPNRSDGNIQAALGSACNQVRRVIQQLGPMSAPSRVLAIAPSQAVLSGIKLGATYLAKAIGPQGLAVAVAPVDGQQLVTKSGSEIARGIHGAGYEERGILELRELTHDLVATKGDGAKLAALLFAALADQGSIAASQSDLPRDVFEGMRKGVEAAVTALRAAAVPTSSASQVLAVARTSAQNVLIASLITEAIEKVGKDGVITVQDAEVTAPALEFAEGMQFDRGYVSPSFVQGLASNKLEFEDCYVAITTEKLSTFQELLPLMELVVGTGRPLLIIAEDVVGDALATLLVNAKQRILSSVAIRAPGTSNRSRALLEDLAILTGATLFAGDLGLTLDRATVSDLGRARHVAVDEHLTTIVGGAGNPEQIGRRAAQLRSAVTTAATDYDREKLHERLARLRGGVATILVGGMTYSEKVEIRQQVSSALHSTLNAIKGGAVTGGGRAYYAVRRHVSAVKAGNPAERAGIDAVLLALEAPIRAIIATARKDPSAVLATLDATSSDDLGFDAASGEVSDLRLRGIVDPAETIVHALEAALTHARHFLLTDSWDLIPQTVTSPQETTTVGTRAR